MTETALSAGIVTADPQELVRFCRVAFGFEEESTSQFPQGLVIRLRCDAARVKLYQPAGGAADVPPAEPWFRDQGFGYAALHVDDVRSVHDRAVGAGATSLAEPTEHRPGAVYALVRDPQGNVWELLQER